MALFRVLEVDKVRMIESLMTRAGFGFAQYRVLLLCSLIQMGGYAVLVSGMLASSELSDSATPLRLVLWPEWLIKPALAWITGVFADKFGRRFTLCASLTVAVGVIVGSSFCVDRVEPFLVCRTFLAIVLGALQVVTYVIVAESVPAKQRRWALFSLVGADSLGHLYGSTIMITASGLELRIRLLICAIPMLLAVIAAFALFISETPKYLVVSGRAEQAYGQLEKSDGFRADPPNMTREEFARSMTSCVRRTCERGRVSEVLNGKRSKALLAQWAIQSVSYWGAMTAIPPLYQSWADSRSHCTKLEVLLLLNLFELVGIIVAAYFADKMGSEKTLARFSIFGALFIFCTTGSLAINETWILFATVCGMFASLTPVWGILFVITTEAFPAYCRATGLGVMMTMKLFHGILEVAIPTAASWPWWLPIVLTGAAGFVSIVGIYITKHFLSWSPATASVMSPIGSRTRTYSGSVTSGKGFPGDRLFDFGGPAAHVK